MEGRKKVDVAEADGPRAEGWHTEWVVQHAPRYRKYTKAGLELQYKSCGAFHPQGAIVLVRTPDDHASFKYLDSSNIRVKDRGILDVQCVEKNREVFLSLGTTSEPEGSEIVLLNLVEEGISMIRIQAICRRMSVLWDCLDEVFPDRNVEEHKMVKLLHEFSPLLLRAFAYEPASHKVPRHYLGEYGPEVEDREYLEEQALLAATEARFARQPSDRLLLRTKRDAVVFTQYVTKPDDREAFVFSPNVKKAFRQIPAADGANTLGSGNGNGNRKGSDDAEQRNSDHSSTPSLLVIEEEELGATGEAGQDEQVQGGEGEDKLTKCYSGCKTIIFPALTALLHYMLHVNMAAARVIKGLQCRREAKLKAGQEMTAKVKELHEMFQVMLAALYCATNKGEQVALFGQDSHRASEEGSHLSKRAGLHSPKLRDCGIDLPVASWDALRDLGDDEEDFSTYAENIRLGNPNQAASNAMSLAVGNFTKLSVTLLVSNKQNVNTYGPRCKYPDSFVDKVLKHLNDYFCQPQYGPNFFKLKLQEWSNNQRRVSSKLRYFMLTVMKACDLEDTRDLILILDSYLEDCPVELPQQEREGCELFFAHVRFHLGLIRSRKRLYKSASALH